MLPSVNSLLEFPGILRDSLGNFAAPSGAKTIAVRFGPQNAQAMRQNSRLRGCAGSDDDLRPEDGHLPWRA
jgi:hypothetical protein